MLFYRWVIRSEKETVKGPSHVLFFVPVFYLCTVFCCVVFMNPMLLNAHPVVTVLFTLSLLSLS